MSGCETRVRVFEGVRHVADGAGCERREREGSDAQIVVEVVAATIIPMIHTSGLDAFVALAIVGERVRLQLFQGDHGAVVHLLFLCGAREFLQHQLIFFGIPIGLGAFRCDLDPENGVLPQVHGGFLLVRAPHVHQQLGGRLRHGRGQKEQRKAAHQE